MVSEDLQSADPLANAPCEDRLTRCRESFTEAHLERLALAERCGEYEHRIAAMEAENAALRAFVAAYDAHEAFRRTAAENGMESWIAEWEWLLRKAKEARQRLATDHGLPLPREEDER